MRKGSAEIVGAVRSRLHGSWNGEPEMTAMEAAELKDRLRRLHAFDPRCGDVRLSPHVVALIGREPACRVGGERFVKEDGRSPQVLLKR